MAQLVPLISGEHNVLSLDINRLYNYNLYEKSRWGLGLQYDIKLDGNRFSTLSLSGYGAYGYADQRIKWGLKADLQSKLRHRTHTYVEFFHDLTPDGSRILTNYQLSAFNSTGSFMTRHFSDTYRFTLGFSRQATANRTDGFELRLSRERYLHGIDTLIYPQSYSDLIKIRNIDFAEGRILIAHTSGLRGELLAGFMGGKELSLRKLSDPHPEEYRIRPFFRLLMQYGHEFYFSAFEFDIFAQCGYADIHAPYSRLFDLGGTWSCPLLMERSLLTARPNEFTANCFGFINLKLSTQEPLFRLHNEILAIGTAPTPFLLCDAAWGILPENSPLTAPDKGIAEVGAGIDGLLVWGAVKWGGAVVYRLTPESAVYHFSDPKDNLTILLTAQLNL